MTRESMSIAKKEAVEAPVAVEGEPAKCPQCYGDIDSRAAVCPHCNKNLRERSGRYQGGSFLMALGLLAALADLVVLGTGLLVVGGVLVFLAGWVMRRGA